MLLFHHGLDAGEADLGAVGAVLVGEDGIFKGKPGFAVLFDEADGNVLHRVGVFEQVRGDVVEDAVDILLLDGEGVVLACLLYTSDAADE